MAKLYKRPDSKTPWWFTLSHRGRVYREAAGRTKVEAEATMLRRISEIKEGHAIPEHRRAAFTVANLAELWASRPATKAKATASHDAVRFVRIVELLGPRPIDTLRRADIDGPKGLVAQLSERSLSDATVNRHLALLKSALRYAKAQGYDHHDPMAGVVLAREPSRMRVASPQELQAILEHADPELRLAVTLAVETAARRTELVALDWAQVDLEGRRFRLRSQDTKTKTERHVPLSRAAVAALAALPHRTGRVFVTTPDSISHRFAKACARANVADLRFHDLRRTSATNLRRAGVDLLTVQKITGHKSLAMLQRYEAVTFDDTLAAVDRRAEHAAPAPARRAKPTR